MKQTQLLRYLEKPHCRLKREGRSHSLGRNPNTDTVEAIPRHTEIPDRLAHKICRKLSVPEVGKE